ncbi:MAG TPA: hypothetical protein VG455_12140, partial [Acidimicrobiales bacterium]|nr:hypothetical protein [Acidimicrobiales bacterium]
MSAVTIPPGPLADHRAGRRQSIVALAKIEAGRMTLSPAFVLGLAASVASLTIRPGTEDWAGQDYYTASTAWTFLWMGTMAAAAGAAGRDRFVSEPDLFPGTPATPADRVLGTALGLVGPALAAAVAVAAVALLKVRSGGFVVGEAGYSRAIDPGVFEWVQPVLLVVLAGVVGIAVAQLRRGRLPVLLVAVVAVFFAGTAIWAFQAHPVRGLHPFMFPSYEDVLPDSFTPGVWGPDDPPLLPPGEFSSNWHAVRFAPGAL